MYISFFKRFSDILISFTGIVVLSPLFFLITVFLLISNKGNPFFLQVRPGKNERVFRLLKFKTMTDDRDQDGNLLPDNQRITGIGSFIRKTSLDEMPQLLNVIKGDMSLIGPRPLLVEYLPLYNDEQRKRHNVRPGITGLAQVNGRNAINWDKKLYYDVWYVENISFILDFKIILKTVRKVIKSEGIDSNAEITMEKFKGNKKQ
jgi:undecaprenyl phosphate N,N'-diacetylbacillosamine 1-phosphate transferase